MSDFSSESKRKAEMKMFSFDWIVDKIRPINFRGSLESSFFFRYNLDLWLRLSVSLDRSQMME